MDKQSRQDREIITATPNKVTLSLQQMRFAFDFYHLEGHRLTEDEVESLLSQLDEAIREATILKVKLEGRYRSKSAENNQFTKDADADGLVKEMKR